MQLKTITILRRFPHYTAGDNVDNFLFRHNILVFVVTYPFKYISCLQHVRNYKSAKRYYKNINGPTQPLQF
jgi:hypothetical protein